MVVATRKKRIRPGYKETDVGVIPEHWDVKRLGDLGLWKGGATPSMGNTVFWSNGNVPWASSGDIKSRLLSDTPLKITEAAVKQSSATLLPSNSVLIVTRSGILRKYLPVAKNTKPMAINQDIKALVPSGKVDPDYVLHLLIGSGPRILATCLKSGTTVESIEYPWLKAYQVPLPPLPEQRAIATALSDVDAGIDGLDQIIAKKLNIKTAVMQQLLTGKRRLAEFKGEWEGTRLREECELITKGTTPTSLGKQFTRSGINFIKIETLEENGSVVKENVAFIDEDTNNLLKRSQLRVKDILISIAGALGRVALVTAEILPANTNQALAIVRLKTSSKLDHGFLFYYLNSWAIKKHIEAINVQGAQANLSLENVGNFVVGCPSLPEQIAIARILSDMDADIAALRARRDKVQALKQGMMQQLLTGNICLI